MQLDQRLTRRWDLFTTGVTTDAATPKMAKLMALTSLLYLVVEVSAGRASVVQCITVGPKWKGRACGRARPTVEPKEKAERMF